jgi:hypothetical protein
VELAWSGLTTACQGNMQRITTLPVCRARSLGASRRRCAANDGFYDPRCIVIFSFPAFATAYM